MSEASSIDRDLKHLETELKRLEGEYNMFFAGRLLKPPWDTRSRVEALVKQCDRAFIQNYAQKFRFMTLQSRFTTFVDLWDRALRAREEGRPGPFSPPRKVKTPEADLPNDRIVYVASFEDPMSEMDKLQELYDRLAEARREVGQDSVPFHKFADQVRTQVEKLREAGSREVAFRVSVRNGKVNFTARGLKGMKP